MIRLRRSSRALALAALVLFALGAAPSRTVSAASPATGTLSESSSSVTWTGGPLVPTASADCGGPQGSGCDNFALTVVAPSSSFVVEITVTPQGVDDWDLQVYGPQGTLVGTSGNSPGQVERVLLVNPAAGVYTVSAAPFAAALTYQAVARLAPYDEPVPPPPSGETPPGYSVHVAPAPLGRSAGEPTLGVNDKTGKVMYIAGLETLRVSFDDCSSPAKAQWEDVSFITTSQTTLDPILFTDQPLGRTFACQLAGKAALTAFTDDDGASWLPSQGSGINSGVDHQAIGGGPFAPSLIGPTTAYRNAVYYCSQDIVTAQCALSRDGGLTFGPAIPIYNLTECGGLHGHPKVGPDGSVYVPNKGCNGEQAVSVSRDNGLTWTVKHVGSSSAGEWDPSVAIATDGTVYFGFGDGDGRPKVAVSRDGGSNWAITDIGGLAGLAQTAFPVIVAGDPQRAAFAFLGSSETTPGASGDDPNWPGAWYLYVAHTFDGGASWTVTNATPGDPVQRGTICAGGVSCATTRNLLDFMDITVDREGRALVGFADGCIGGCFNGRPNSFTAVAAIARQTSGKRLYAAFDPTTGAPHAPAVEASQKGDVALLSWSTPDARGSVIGGYNIYRRAEGQAQSLLASVGADVHSYADTTVVAGTRYFYAVRATSDLGEGAGCEVEAVAVPDVPAADTCHAPGTRVASDPGGDGVPAALDIESITVAEPASADGTEKLVFTLNVADLTSFTPGNAWYVLWNRPSPDATADRAYVVMRATAPDTVAYKYGRISPPSVNQATDLGDADAGSFSPDGTITITLATSKADGVLPGQSLGGLEVRSFLANVSGMPVSQATAIDYTTPGEYTLAGSEKCRANRGPSAVDDTATTKEGKPVAVNVLSNDSDPDGDALSIVALTAPANGRVVSKKHAPVTYKPNGGFRGVDRFTYTVSDGKSGTDTATVTVTVTR